jgi:hypothetical protein
VSLYMFGLEHIVTTKELQKNQNKFPWFIRVQYVSHYKQTSLEKTTDKAENYINIKLKYHPFNIILSTNFGTIHTMCYTKYVFGHGV